MRYASVLCAAGLLTSGLSAQPLIQELGGGVGLQGITFFHVDETSDVLFMSGSFAYANDEPVSPGILRWDSQGFGSVGCGVEWNCVEPGSLSGLANPALSVIRWNGDLYLGGAIFFNRDGHEYNGLMRWDGEAWHPLGAGCDGKVTSLRVIDDQLIVTGWFQYADTVLANGLARWDGERWHRVVDVPEFYPGRANYVNDVAKFQGEWHIGGILLSMGDLARFRDGAWERVANGFIGTYSSVQKLHVHEGKLYVNGTFSACPPYGVPSNPGSGIVAWDGENWDDLGGGTCGATLPDVFSTVWWNGDLYATGRFDRIGGVQGSKLARWDGEEWCMLFPENYFPGGGPNALAIYHDSLYIGGAFTQAGPTTISCFGKWVGGDQTFGCGSLVGMDEQQTHDVDGLAVFPSPTQDLLNIRLPDGSSGDLRLEVFDPSGRSVFHVGQWRNAPLDVSGLAQGVYMLVITDLATAIQYKAEFMKQ